MSFPTLAVEIAVTTKPTEAPTWVDVTAYTYSIRVRRGRSSERQQPDMGTCEILLDNADRRFDPSYAAGPYYGNLLPMRRLRVSATLAYQDGALSGTWTKRVFNGFVDGWPQKWDGDGTIPLVTLRASDGFKVLGMMELNTTFSAERSDVRIDNVLDAVGWTAGTAWVLDSATNSQLDTSTILAPNGDRVLMVGDTTIQAADLAAANALQHILEVAQSEGGIFFVDGSGAVVFENRHWLTHPQNMVPAGVFEDGPLSDLTHVGYLNYEVDYNDEMVFNDVRVTRVDGEEQTASDNTSQLVYFKRTLSEDRLLMATDYEAADRANWLCSYYKAPRYTAPQIEFVLGAEMATVDWRWFYTDRELNDRIQVIRHPQGSTAAITNDYHILSIEHEIGLRDDEGGQRWGIRWKLGSVDPITTYWHLAESTGDYYQPYSVLETSTILNY